MHHISSAIIASKNYSCDLFIYFTEQVAPSAGWLREKKKKSQIRSYNDYTSIHNLRFINLLDFIGELVNVIKIKYCGWESVPIMNCPVIKLCLNMLGECNV